MGRKLRKWVSGITIVLNLMLVGCVPPYEVYFINGNIVQKVDGCYVKGGSVEVRKGKSHISYANCVECRCVYKELR